ncbi:MAG: hypothetical protein K0Q59_4614 [Paenibacillus sp.]|jgi:hypothetical protein|nr:hypothetical protein [Paenibacillus sp.]
MPPNSYEDTVRLRLAHWERKLMRPPGMLEKTSKSIQRKLNAAIPANVHNAMTTAVKTIFRTVLFTLDYVPQANPLGGLTLAERDEKATAVINTYKKLAAVEGAGTGAGGFAFGLVDFPALIAIKIRCLFELAHCYGYSTRDYRERLFLLYLFQLAFSGRDHRMRVYRIVRNWDETAKTYPPGESGLATVNWEKLQQEYRDAIDLRKLLQLVPGLGAVVGAWANYGLLEELGEAAMNGFRLRLLTRK